MSFESRPYGQTNKSRWIQGVKELISSVNGLIPTECIRLASLVYTMSDVNELRRDRDIRFHVFDLTLVANGLICNWPKSYANMAFIIIFMPGIGETVDEWNYKNVLGNPYFSSHLLCISITVRDTVFAHQYMLLYGLSARTNKWFEQNYVCLRTHCYTSIEVIANNVLPKRR